MMEKERHRQRRARLHEQGRCERCGGEDARTRRGLSLCRACTDGMLDYHRQRYAERKAAGVCTYCGKSDSYTGAGKHLCFDCSVKRAAKRRKESKK